MQADLDLSVPGLWNTKCRLALMSTKYAHEIYLAQLLLAAIMEKRDFALSSSLTDQIRVGEIANTVRKILKEKTPNNLLCQSRNLWVPTFWVLHAGLLYPYLRLEKRQKVGQRSLEVFHGS